MCEGDRAGRGVYGPTQVSTQCGSRVAGRTRLCQIRSVAGSDFKMIAGSTAGVTAVVARSRQSFDRHTHEEFGIGTIFSGGQRWHSGGRQAEAGPGALIAVNPGEVHDGAPVGDERQWLMVYLPVPLLVGAAQDVSGREERDFAVANPVLGDARAAAALMAVFTAETAGTDACKREEVLLALTARIGPFGEVKARPSVAAVAAAQSRIDDDPTSPVSLSDLALLGGVSRFQLLRSFVRETGLTPHAYIVQRRIDLARRLLASEVPPADAAAAAGFCDQSHMTRAFTRRYGVTPGAFVKALH